MTEVPVDGAAPDKRGGQFLACTGMAEILNCLIQQRQTCLVVATQHGDRTTNGNQFRSGFSHAVGQGIQPIREGDHPTL